MPARAQWERYSSLCSMDFIICRRRFRAIVGVQFRINLLSKQIRKDQTKEFTNNLHQVIDGEFVETREGPAFHQKGMIDDLSLGNLSTGLKAFVYKDINVMPKAEFQHEFVDQINACREVQ